MRLDYSPPETSTRAATHHRSFLVAMLVLVSAGALMSREGTAKRHDADASEDAAQLAVISDANLVATLAPATPAPVPDATPADSPVPAPAAIPATDSEEPWTIVEVKRGDTLSRIFERELLPRNDWVQLLALGGETRGLKTIRPGEELRIRKDDAGLSALRYELDEARTLLVHRTAAGFEAQTVEAEIERRTNFASGEIRSSPWEAGIEAGLPEPLIIQMADVFGYDIDFGLDLRVGDRFTVIYDEVYKDGKKLRAGDILAAEFVNQGKPFRAVRFTDPSGNTGFYAPGGESLRKAFIRTPLNVFRISSNFSYGRRHPVLNRIRAHLGTDYAAPTGTPIKATGDGRISFLGRKGGYGRTIMIRHGGSIETLYAHMSSFRSGLRTGSRVQQGQVIGYVGSSGLATGPHLHYEFRVNGAHRNPRTVTLPRSDALPRRYVENFRAYSNPLLAQLDALDPTRLAQAD